jgi:hypothetical protein
MLCRYPDLIALALQNHGSVRNMADVWNKDVQKRAINERSIAVSQFKTLWLSNASPYALVTNCLETDLKKQKG